MMLDENTNRMKRRRSFLQVHQRRRRRHVRGTRTSVRPSLLWTVFMTAAIVAVCALVVVVVPSAPLLVLAKTTTASTENHRIHQRRVGNRLMNIKGRRLQQQEQQQQQKQQQQQQQQQNQNQQQNQQQNQNQNQNQNGQQQQQQNQQQQQSLLDIIDSSWTYSSLSNIISTSGLRTLLEQSQQQQQQAPPITVFAPTNGGIAVIPNIDMYVDPQYVDGFTPLHLTQLVLMHMTEYRNNFGDPLSISDLRDGTTIEMLNGQSVNITNQNGLVTFITSNGNIMDDQGQDIIKTAESIVTDDDVPASDGILHPISPALLPSFSFVDLYEQSDSLFFRQLIVTAGLEEVLRTQPLTLLLPTSTAFINVPSSAYEDVDQLQKILRYHVLDGVYPSMNLQDGQQVPTLLDGTSIQVNVLPSLSTGSSTMNENVISFNGYPATVMNILANNGIIYRIDTVLQPGMNATSSTGTGTTTTTNDGATNDNTNTNNSGDVIVGGSDDNNGQNDGSSGNNSNNDDNNNNNNAFTLGDLIANDSSLSAFEAAILRAGYTDNLERRPPKTVFAPVNSVFTAATQDYMGMEWIAHLQNLILMHVTFDTVTSPIVSTAGIDMGTEAISTMSTTTTTTTTTSSSSTTTAESALSQFSDGQQIRMLNGEFVTLSVGSSGSVTLIGPSDGAGGTIIGRGGGLTAIPATNGVLYRIDGVLLPPWDSRDVVDTMTTDGRFTTFLDWLSRVGIADQLRNGQYTVLAPTDDAFAMLDPNLIPSSIDQIRDIVLYHIIPRILPSSLLQSGTRVQTMAPSDSSEGYVVPQVIPNGGGISFNGMDVLEADILANNGIVYAMSAALDPYNVPEEMLSQVPTNESESTPSPSVEPISEGDGDGDGGGDGGGPGDEDVGDSDGQGSGSIRNTISPIAMGLISLWTSVVLGSLL